MKPAFPRPRFAHCAGALFSAFALCAPALANDNDNDSDRFDNDRDKHLRHARPIACAALTGKNIDTARITAAEPIAATATTPPYCRVRALIAPKLNFELRLPTEWNRKLHYGGGGGYNGAIPPVDLNALRQGYAQVSSDSGHQGNVLDASFVQNDALAARQFGSESVPDVMAPPGAASAFAVRLKMPMMPTQL
jgi:Tannase and feruloyl esterase